MSPVSQSTFLLVVLLVAWNGDHCQAQSEASSPGMNNIMGEIVKVGVQATMIDWHPPQSCWMNIVQEVRDSCSSGLSMNCINPETTTEFSSCLQREIVSNGANLWTLAMRIASLRRQQQQQDDESTPESS